METSTHRVACDGVDNFAHSLAKVCVLKSHRASMLPTLCSFFLVVLGQLNPQLPLWPLLPNFHKSFTSTCLRDTHLCSSEWWGREQSCHEHWLMSPTCVWAEVKWEKWFMIASKPCPFRKSLRRWSCNYEDSIIWEVIDPTFHIPSPSGTTGNTSHFAISYTRKILPCSTLKINEMNEAIHLSLLFSYN
jgi:hypothetical protein